MLSSLRPKERCFLVTRSELWLDGFGVQLTTVPYMGEGLHIPLLETFTYHPGYLPTLINGLARAWEPWRLSNTVPPQAPGDIWLEHVEIKGTPRKQLQNIGIRGKPKDPSFNSRIFWSIWQRGIENCVLLTTSMTFLSAFAVAWPWRTGVALEKQDKGGGARGEVTRPDSTTPVSSTEGDTLIQILDTLCAGYCMSPLSKEPGEWCAEKAPEN